MKGRHPHAFARAGGRAVAAALYKRALIQHEQEKHDEHPVEGCVVCRESAMTRRFENHYEAGNQETK